ncbi:CPBP family glutamic-type intramembrane protease [Pseudonocardia kujensis]|uniref:CPBP family glutamic-type intramembrane protease n=1 Tax=Pseudonocardia kujensis TaxID=1128675 RepID=UPI003557D516
MVVSPLHSAEEEYGFRGLMLQAAASWPRGAAALARARSVVSAVLFAVIHGSTDVWHDIYNLVLTQPSR